jgi:hypothetical protein
VLKSEVWTRGPWIDHGNECLCGWVSPGGKEKQGATAGRVWSFPDGSGGTVWGWRANDPWGAWTGKLIDSWDAQQHPERKPATSKEEGIALCDAAFMAYCAEHNRREGT